MIVDKKTNTVISDNKPSALAPDVPQTPEYEVQEQIPANGAVEVIKAIMDILKQVTWEYGVPNSPKVFRTVQYDDGQYERIIRKTGNREEAIGFPAAFVHFINMNWTVSAQRFNDARCELRIRFVLNRLDAHVNDHSMDVYYVAERINQTIQLMRSDYPCLAKRCILTYVDPLESFDNGLQPCWVTYEIWFTTTNIWVTRNKTLRKIVFPPFVNHADQDPEDEDNNLHNHTNISHPITYDEATDYQTP